MFVLLVAFYMYQWLPDLNVLSRWLHHPLWCLLHVWLIVHSEAAYYLCELSRRPPLPYPLCCLLYVWLVHSQAAYVCILSYCQKKNVCILSSSATAGSARGCAGTSQGFIFSVWETYHWAIGTRNISHNIAHDLSTVFIYSFKNSKSTDKLI
jgi:hypothetical protein